MPILRSQRASKPAAENLEIKDNVSEIEEQTRKQKVNKNTRSGRGRKETRSVLKDLNDKEDTTKRAKNKKNNKSVSDKMESDGNDEKSELTVKETVSKTPQTNENVNETEAINKTSEEAMDVTENTEDNDEVSPNKKQKLDQDEPKTNETTEKVNNETEEKAQQSGEAVANQLKNADNQEAEEKPSTNSTLNASVSKSKSISLKSQINSNKDAGDAGASSNNLPKQLLTVISNLYLNVGERLRLDFPPRCLDDLAFCHRHHYRSELPEAPITSQAHSLRSALQHFRYVSFINATTYMCHRGEFPGKGIFTKIMELVLVSLKYLN